MHRGVGGKEDRGDLAAWRGEGLRIEHLSGLALLLLTALATFPVSGWRLALGWLAAMVVLTAAQQLARPAAVFAWLRNAGYSAAAFYLVALHTGAAQTFGVTLMGLVLFQTLARDYAHPRRLAVTLTPPVLAVAVAQLGAGVGLVVGHQPLLLITLLASPVAVFGLLRTVQNDLRDKRRRLDAAVA